MTGELWRLDGWNDLWVDDERLVGKRSCAQATAPTPTRTGAQEFADGSVLGGVDLVLVCTGYEYHIPFLFGGTTGPLQHPVGLAKDKGFGTRLLRVEDRAVFPLYQHLFHARFPSLSFMGLPHSVVPFRA